MNNGYFPSYFGHHHGIGAPPPPPPSHLLNPALSSWSAAAAAANPHLAAAAMAAAAAEQHLRGASSNPAAAAFHHHHNPYFPPAPPPPAVSAPAPTQHQMFGSLATSSSSSYFPKSDEKRSTTTAPSWSNDQQSTSSSHLFNTGLPPLDRHGLFPSHGSILDPLHTPSYQPKSDSYRPKDKPPEPPKQVQTVNLESDEEVLVDDFDGQCCRTYPDNHSRILKWRAKKAEKAAAKAAALLLNKTTTVATISSSTVVSTNSVVKSLGLKKPHSDVSSSKSKDTLPTTSASSKPVGITIGRQRQPGATPTWPLTSPTGAACGPSQALSSLVPPPSGPSSTPGLNPWLPPHHMQPSPAGPIPMGYQLAKDPLTGQILLIPTDPSQAPAPHASPWPPHHPHHGHLHGRYEPYGGLDRIPQSPGVLQSHYQQLYLQQQQHLRYYQGLSGSSDPLRSSLLPSPASGPPNRHLLHSPSSAPKRPEALRKEPPETITVSDDEEEKEEPKQASPQEASKSSEEKIPEVEPQAMDLVASKSQSQPADLSIVKQEPMDQPLSRSEDLRMIAESLIQLSIFQQQEMKVEEVVEKSSDQVIEKDGLETLLKGIELHESTKDGIDMLCAVTQEDSYQVPYFSSHMMLSTKIDVLCCVTKGDKVDFDHYVDPLCLLKQRFNLHDYHSSSSAQDINTFIQQKMQHFKKLALAEAELQEGQQQSYVQDDPQEPPSLAKMLKKIKNTEFLSDLEVELRKQLDELQEVYKEKQSKLSRLKSPRKRLQKKSKVNKNIKKTPNKRTTTPKRRNSSSGSPAPKSSVSEIVGASTSKAAPPRLEPSSPPRLQSAAECWNVKALLKPPKLTASSTASARKSVTDLSTIKAKFMKGRPSPFANLMSKLASTPSAPSSSGGNSPVKTMPDIDEGDEDPELPDQPSDLASESSEADQDNSTEDEYTFKDHDHKSSPGKRARSSSFEDSSSSKKRKADKPKKQSGITETIVPKKPKNLFMMYDFDDDQSDTSKDELSEDEKPLESSERKDSPLKVKKSRPKNEADPSPRLRDARLMENDLRDGLKLLILQEGRFWPSRLNSTQLPDVYGIVMEKQRGNRPQILPRDDILKEAIFEVKPENKSQLPIGTRVCVYWSRAYNCLFPGTIEDLEDVVLNKDNMVQVLLDDGDRRQVELGSVRMLPNNYSHVDYDPDPIASLRKRRISADSADSGSHRETMHSLMSSHVPPITSPLAKSEGSHSVKKKGRGDSVLEKHKHKKKRKHHHCKRKHKRHNQIIKSHQADSEDDSLKIKLDGSFNNTTTYSIRSPMYQHKSEDSNHDEESSEEFEDSSTSESETEDNQPKPRKTGINPVTGRPLWQWADEGYKRPGSKGKAKKLFHRSIGRENETISVGDCAVFLSTARVDRPYIGQVELLWETWNGNMMVKVKWFYHPEEIENAQGGTVDLRVPGGLFQSPHTDENDVQTISHKCSVLPLKEYSRLMISDPAKRKKIYSSSDTYYLAGSYDPTAMNVNFQPGVLRH